jgi:hypothetical protein
VRKLNILFHRADGHLWAVFVLLYFLILSTVILVDTLGAFYTNVLSMSHHQDTEMEQNRFLWVTEFPLFTRADEDKEFLAHGRWSSSHHPFTAPMIDDIELIQKGGPHLAAVCLIQPSLYLVLTKGLVSIVRYEVNTTTLYSMAWRLPEALLEFMTRVYKS